VEENGTGDPVTRMVDLAKGRKRVSKHKHIEGGAKKRKGGARGKEQIIVLGGTQNNRGNPWVPGERGKGKS